MEWEVLKCELVSGFWPTKKHHPYSVLWAKVIVMQAFAYGTIVSTSHQPLKLKMKLNNV